MCPALLRFLAWPRRDEGAYPQRSVTEEQRRPGQKSEATLRARALWAVCRRCSLLTDRCGYARRSRLAIQPKALSRGAHGYFNRLLMPFPRPKKSPARPGPKPAPPASTAAGTVEEAPVSRSNVVGTLLALFGIMITAFTMEGAQPSSLARFAAIGVAISLGISVLADLRHGVRNVIRADVMALAAFYFLTLFEFLFPQE